MTELEHSTKKPTSTSRPVLEVPRLQELPEQTDSTFLLRNLVSTRTITDPRTLGLHLMSPMTILTERELVESEVSYVFSLSLSPHPP
jgi:hypothetical protein